MPQSAFNWEFEIPTWEHKENVRRILDKCRKQGVSAEHAKKTLVHYGFDQKLVDRFLDEITEGKA